MPPPPSLEALVSKHGGWDKVPDAEFKEFIAARQNWKDKVRFARPEFQRTESDE